MNDGIIIVDPADPKGFLPYILKSSMDKNTILLGYGSGDMAVGLLQAHINSRAVMIDRIFIADSFRRFGIGGLLLEEVLRRTEDIAVTDIFALYSFGKDDRQQVRIADCFFRKYGFEKEDSTQCFQFNLGDVKRGIYASKLNRKSRNCYSASNQLVNNMKIDKAAITKDGTWPLISVRGHLDQSQFYVVDDVIKGCLILDEASDGVRITDFRGEGALMVHDLLIAALIEGAKAYPDDTRIYAAPESDRIKKLIANTTGKHAVCSAITTRYVYRGNS